MARQNQIDRALESLEAKRADILLKAQTEADAIGHAISTLKSQKVKARVSRPRAVTEKVEKVG